MNKATKIEWTISGGRTAWVEVRLTTSREIDADGDKTTKACGELTITGNVQGHGVTGYSISRKPITIHGTTYPATIGRLLIPAEKMPFIEAAIAEAEQDADYRIAQSSREQYEAACRRVAASERRIYKMMEE